MPCGCGQKRKDRLAAKKSVQASAKVQATAAEPQPFEPARWSGTKAKEQTA